MCKDHVCGLNEDVKLWIQVFETYRSSSTYSGSSGGSLLSVFLRNPHLVKLYLYFCEGWTHVLCWNVTFFYYSFTTTLFYIITCERRDTMPQFRWTELKNDIFQAKEAVGRRPSPIYSMHTLVWRRIFRGKTAWRRQIPLSLSSDLKDVLLYRCIEEFK